MKLTILIQIALFVIYFYSTALAKQTSTTSDRDGVDDELEDSAQTDSNKDDYSLTEDYDSSHDSATTSAPATTTSAYDDLFYDEDESSSDDTSSAEHTNNESSLQSQCPSVCKCKFIKNTARKKRANDYDNDVSDKEETEDEYVNKHRTTNKAKYDIHIDCSGLNLNSIGNLFDYDFPVEQIVSFNLSNNKFKYLKLDDGFEDLVSLKILDLSSNQNLKYISPKNFLKKFKYLQKIYLNNLNQINCKESSKSPIDCKWYRTLIYLHKRNVSVTINEPLYCDLNELANSASIMSRCFIDINSNRFAATTDTNSTLFQIDNTKFDFRIEPELNQALIEGDTLELTCKLKRLGERPSYSSNQFFKSSIKWYLNEKQPLSVSTIYYNKDAPTQIQIFETKNKFRSDDLIESKLIITNTLSSHNSGKYSCMAITYLLNNKRASLNTTGVEIKILNKQELELGDAGLLSKSAYQDKASLAMKLFCPEIITQSYKGVYKWPKTLANSKITQKCTSSGFGNGTQTGKEDSIAPNDFAVFQCLPNGKWAEYVDLSQCQFESNLTRYLFNLTRSAYIENINLEQFIHRIVSIQSAKEILNTTILQDTAEFNQTPTKSQINMYDVLYIQKYLIKNLSSNRTNLQSGSWKQQFMWLNDMLSKLNPFYLNKAKQMDVNTFSAYFFECLLPIVSSINSSDLSGSGDDEDYYYDYVDSSTSHKNKTKPVLADDMVLLSSYLATYLVSPKMHISNKLNTTHIQKLNGAKLVCDLDKYKLTHQLYLKCYDKPKMSSKEELQTRIEIGAGLINSYLANWNEIKLIVFENDSLFPVSESANSSVYDMTNLVEYKKLVSANDEFEEFDSEQNITCSQVFALVSSNQSSSFVRVESQLNLTLEIKMPSKFYELIGLIELKVINKTVELNAQNGSTSITANEKSIVVKYEKDKNLFDQIFYKQITEPNTNDEYAPTTNPQHLDINEAILADLAKLKYFKKSLFNKWLNLNNYEIIYGAIKQPSANKTTKIEWSTNQVKADFKPLINKCKLIALDSTYVPSFTKFNQTKKLIKTPELSKTRLYARLSCNLADNTLTEWNGSYKPIQFLSLRHISQSPAKTSAQTKLENLFDEYSRIFRLSLSEDDSYSSLITKLITNLAENYQTFSFKIIYFASVASSTLLGASIFIYILLRKRLLMPRSFFHVYINTWLCVCLLILAFTFGINQISLPYVCLSSAILLHYLTLCTSAWYTLYFYALFAKLRTLKARNYKLIYSRGEIKLGDEAAIKQNEYEHESGEYIQKPVLHYYMLGWGVPSLLCSIIISITKREYIQVPFGFCFTNESHILLGSLLVPIGVLFVVKVVFVVLIVVTLSKILNDLRNETDSDDEKSDEHTMTPDELNDKAELCEKWANNKSNFQNFDDLKGEEMIEIKMNPVTQKSIIVSVNDNNKYGDGSSFDGNRSDLSNLSERTSIMDAQYKPNVQLKFACFSFVVLVFIWLLAAGLTCSGFVLASFNVSLAMHELAVKIISYLLSLFVFVYAIMQFSFYVLSRDDVSFVKLRIKNPKVFDSCLNFCFADSKSVKPMENEINQIPENDNNYNSNHWYFEPRDEDPLHRKDTIDCVPKQQPPPVYERRVFNITSEKVYEEQKLQQNTSSDYLDEKMKTFNESSDDNNEHKESICDVIFSAKKSNLTKQSASTASLKSNTSSGVISTSDTHSSNENIVKMGDLSNLVEPDASNDSNQATLAVQEEDLTEYLHKTITNEETNNQNTSASSKKTHVRNPSLGSAAQTIQLITGGAPTNEAKESDFNRSNSMRKSGTGKKPLYVYVDYKYEDKVMEKIIVKPAEEAAQNAYSALPTQYEFKSETLFVNQYTAYSATHKAKKNYDDLLNNSCSAHTGTAINSAIINLVPDLLSNSIKTSSLSNTIQTLSSSNSCSSNNNIPNVKQSNGDSIGSSITSSSNSSTNLNPNSNEDNNHYQLITYDDRVKYQNYLNSNNSNRRSDLYSTTSNSWLNNSNSSASNYKQKSQTLASSNKSNSKLITIAQLKSNLDQNGSLLRGAIIRPKEFEAKHETSV